MTQADGHIEYLFFTSEYNSPLSEFKWPEDGFTVYDASQDKIFRCRFYDKDPDYDRGGGKGYGLLPLAIPIDTRKKLIFAYNYPPEVLSGSIVSAIKDKRWTGTELTDDEWHRAGRALERYEAASVKSLTWPKLRPIDLSTLRHASVHSAGSLERGSSPLYMRNWVNKLARMELSRAKAELKCAEKAAAQALRAAKEAGARALFERFNGNARLVDPEDSCLITAKKAEAMSNQPQRFYTGDLTQKAGLD